MARDIYWKLNKLWWPYFKRKAKSLVPTGKMWKIQNCEQMNFVRKWMKQTACIQLISNINVAYINFMETDCNRCIWRQSRSISSFHKPIGQMSQRTQTNVLQQSFVIFNVWRTVFMTTIYWYRSTDSCAAYRIFLFAVSYSSSSSYSSRMHIKYEKHLNLTCKVKTMQTIS